jgi:hypothetical protein
MAHRINERNVGNSAFSGMPKKGTKKLNTEEVEILLKIASVVYDAMHQNEDGKFYDNGNILLSLKGEEMYDLFQAQRKLLYLL